MSKANQIRQKAQEFLSKGHIDKAIQEYRRLLTIESKNPNLYNELGDIYLRAGDKAQAVQNFEKAATIYEKVALYNNAVAVCKKILRVDPEKIDTMFRLGELRAKQKLTGEAVTFFTQYVEAVLENPQVLLPRAQKDVDLMLELMPSNEAILAMAVGIYEQLGMKLKAIEVYGRLVAIAVQEKDSKRQIRYAQKIEEIKAALSPAELENLQTAETVEEGVATPIAGEMSPSPADVPAAEVDSDELAAPPPADSIPVPPDVEPAPAAAEAETEDGKPDESGIDVGMDEAVEEAEMVAAMSQGREAIGTGGSFADRRKPSEDGTSESANEVLSGGTPPGLPDPPAATFAETGSERGETFAEEITSDVEKDDLRSHFDLGMAYLEMGLFTEAIREFQIASRAEEFQLSSMEMIGYCFLKCNQPRLAVKQLTHALEIEKTTGAGSLGIHYNIGLAYEILGEFETAREHFEEVYIMDMSFRDVAEKMKKFSAVT
ncbi:MAG: tetratricopeptide repeat protein [Candidatus Krumholzibacteriia bacterium]